MRPICTKCGTQMKCWNNGTMLRQQPGHPSENGSIWYGDMYKCEHCDATIITGLGKRIDVKSNSPVLSQRSHEMQTIVDLIRR